VIRLTCLQFRIQAAMVAMGLVIVAILVLITGPALAHLYSATVASCKARGDCPTATATLLAKDGFEKVALDVVVFILPALIAMFWGAPLVARELETGTFRLAWTQSVTRKRWLAVRLGVGALTSMAVTGLLSLILTWWFSPIDRVQLNPLDPAMFGVRGIAPVGYAAFAFMLGVTAGILLRRTIPAMAVTLVAFTAARLAVTYYVRPYLMGSLRAISPLVMAAGTGPGQAPGAPTVTPGDWVLSDTTINGAGKVIGQYGGVGPNGGIGFRVSHGSVSLAGVGPCPNTFPASALGGARSASGPPAAFNTAAQECITKLGIRDEVTYQPLSHYWPLQCYETLIFLALAAALTAFCFWRVNRSLT
jgi:hypothetical protein